MLPKWVRSAPAEGWRGGSSGLRWWKRFEIVCVEWAPGTGGVDAQRFSFDYKAIVSKAISKERAKETLAARSDQLAWTSARSAALGLRS